MTKRVIVHLLGLLLLAIGIRIMIIAELGLLPMDALVYYLSDTIFPADFPSQFGFPIASFIINVVVMLICMAIKREKKVALSLINTVIFSAFLAAAGWAFGSLAIPADTVWLNWVVAFIGFLVIAIGIDFTIYSELIVAPIEYAMLLFNSKVKNLTISKLLIEACLFAGVLVFAIARNDYRHIGWFTLISVATISPLLHILMWPTKKVFGPINKNKLKEEKVNEVK